MALNESLFRGRLLKVSDVDFPPFGFNYPDPVIQESIAHLKRISDTFATYACSALISRLLLSERIYRSCLQEVEVEDVVQEAGSEPEVDLLEEEVEVDIIRQTKD